MISQFNVGDTVLNQWDLPIEVVGIAEGYYIGPGGYAWEPRMTDQGVRLFVSDVDLTAYLPANDDSPARVNGAGPQAPANPLFNVGDKVNIVIGGQLQNLEPATVIEVLSPVVGAWGYRLVMADDAESVNAETVLEPATGEGTAVSSLPAPVANGHVNGNGAASEGLPPSSKALSMREFLAHRFCPQEFLVDGLFAKGHLVILGGRPKGGKSWLALQLAQCVDTGTDFLGRETTKARVLLYALEDGDRRVQTRARAIGWQPESAAVLFTIPFLDDGQGGPGPGATEIWEYTKQYDLIMIDTLITAMSGRTDERDNSAMGSLINALAYIAHKSDKAIVIVHHTGKATNPDDIFPPCAALLLSGEATMLGLFWSASRVSVKQSFTQKAGI
jgi:hypothetical protein